jgi:chromatin remodeling complex protein RSC6
MVKSRAELFAEINVTPPAKDSDNESVEGKEDTPERETKVGEKEEKLQAEQPPKKKRKTKKKGDANKENRLAVKDKLVSIFLLCISLTHCSLTRETSPRRENLDSLLMRSLIRLYSEADLA